MAEPTTRLRLRVSPGAGRSEVVGRRAGGWRVRVAAPPERGQANRELARLLAGRLGLPVERVTVVAGRASRDKVVELRGLGAEEVARRLEERR